MTKAELLQRLIVAKSFDQETGHSEADGALVDFIDDAEVTAAYDAIPKWYA
ncbi:MAG TPA: hypothetical protein VIN37_02920 [Candidatus Limnocylindria bacterium]